MAEEGKITNLPLALLIYGDEYLELVQRDRVTGQYKNYRVAISMLRGAEGKSAYQVAVSNGFTGTATEWLASIIGPAGASAYEVAINGGFIGSEAEWLATLKGDAGLSAYELSVQNGFIGTYEEWYASLRGQDGNGVRILGAFSSTEFLPTEGNANGDAYIVDYTMWVWVGEYWEPVGQVGPSGKSAYQLAKDSGAISISTTLSQYLDSLKGKSAYQLARESGVISNAVTLSQYLESLNGDPGASAYQVAVANGFVGDQAAWLASLQGEQGIQGIQGVKGDKGDPANAIRVLGIVNDLSELPGTAEPGDAYYHGLDLHVWNGAGFTNVGSIKGDPGAQGPEGPPGQEGAPGLSAYELAQANGFSGTITQWLASLKGDAGTTGTTGKSVYELAVDFGYVGSEEEYLASLIGRTAYQHAVDEGFSGSLPEWLASLKGEQGERGIQGKSAYQLAVDAGFAGTEADWLLSLKGLDGTNGEDGATAYELAVQGGFSGTIPEWLLSLKGEQGEQGPAGGGLIIAGVLASSAELPATGSPSESYLIGENLWAWIDGAWVDLGPIRGPQGIQGTMGVDGAPGKSAYQVAVDNGFVGNESQWLASLVGEGGLSAYELAVQAGFVGDQTAWLASLQGLDGQDGKSAYQVAVDAGFAGTEADWLASLVGPQGLTGAGITPKGFLADIAALNAVASPEKGWLYLVGTLVYIHDGSAWINHGDTRGATGANGLSAYDIAVGAGFSGTEAEWLLTLMGTTGAQGPEGPIGPGLTPKGTVADLTTLNSITGTTGDAYFIGGQLYAWVDNAWFYFGDLTGPQGVQGPMGPGISILGRLASSAALPETGTLGQGYLIDLDFWGWTGSAFENLGPIQGPKGDQGPQGVQGIQGVQGNDGIQGLKGDPGTRWLAFDREPTSIDGNPNDFFINKSNNAYYMKVNTLNWAFLGYLGGGNVYDAPSDDIPRVRLNGGWVELQVVEAPEDDKPYVRLNGAWYELPVQEAPVDDSLYVRLNGEWVAITIPTVEVDEAPADGAVYVRRSGDWQRFDRYDLVATSTTGVMDLAVGQVFNVSASANRALTFANAPGAGRTMVVVVHLTGNTGVITWPTGISWHGSVAPVLGSTFTTVVLFWNGATWTGGVSHAA